jgi:membrane-bound serine protease (ClpP class)
MSQLRARDRWSIPAVLALALWGLAGGVERLRAADAPVLPADQKQPAPLPAGLQGGKPVRPAALEPAVIIRAEGRIDSLFREYLFRHLDAARSRGAKLVILEINSPGGTVPDSLAVAQRLRETNWAYTIAYVPNMALSGAAFLSLGCDEIIMGHEAQLGDAGPVIQGPDAAFRHAPEKMVSKLAVDLRTLAEAKGRPPALCEAMVNKDLEVFEVTNHKTGQKAFMSDVDLRAAPDRQDWEQGNLVIESRKGLFFTCTGKRAVELSLASASVSDRAALMTNLGLLKMPEILEYTWVDTFAFVLNLWPVTVLLLLVALVCLYIELHAPGIGVAGILSGFCIALFFWSRFLGGTADWLEVTLFVGGVICVGLELFVTTGTLVAGVSGFLMILASLVMAGQENWIPADQYEVRSLLNNLAAIAGAGVIFVMVAAFLSHRLRATPMFSRLMLEPPESGTVAVESGSAPRGALLAVGTRGVSATALRPIGKARFGDQSCEVTAEGIIDPGRPIQVVEITGGRIVVAEVPS